MAETVNYADYADYADHYSEEELKAKLSKTKRLGRKLLKSVFELGYAFMSPDTPVWAKAVIIGALGYFICPVDATPDFIPGVGYVDDGSTFVQTQRQAAYRSGVESGRAGFDGGREQDYL